MEQMEWRNSNDLTVLYSWKFCCCSVAQSCLTSCDPVDCSMPGFPVLHHLEFTQTHSIESVMPSNHLICCCPLLLHLSQCQGLFQCLGSLHQVAKVLELIANQSHYRIGNQIIYNNFKYEMSQQLHLYRWACCLLPHFHRNLLSPESPLILEASPSGVYVTVSNFRVWMWKVTWSHRCL